MCPCGNVALHNTAKSEDTQIHAPTIRHLSINPRPALGTATRRGHREREKEGVPETGGVLCRIHNQMQMKCQKKKRNNNTNMNTATAQTKPKPNPNPEPEQSPQFEMGMVRLITKARTHN